MTFTTLRRAILLIQASGALCLPLARAARPLSFFSCCTRCLDARLVFFAEYKVPPNKPGGKAQLPFFLPSPVFYTIKANLYPHRLSLPRSVRTRLCISSKLDEGVDGGV
ncbi:hypothetical protein B0H13DRAFT_1918581 [Mycena leptocephala]|nr:hypothetical protein B0H13DRAFT_1918581 [Mycena leptocephala]